MKRTLLILVIFLGVAAAGYCQDAGQLLGQVSQIYAENGSQGNGSIAGFSVAGLIGGILFSCVGFVAFMYGKKNTEIKPTVTGLLLLVYPYFIRNTLALYLVGVALIAVLYFWRD